MISLAAWPGAIAIGLSLGLLGSGGSILTVPVLVYLIGQDEKLAIAGSLFIVGSIALAGSLQYLRSGLIDWRSVATFGIPGMIGTWLGALAAAYVSGLLQLSLFAVVILAASWFMLKPVAISDQPHAARALWKIAASRVIPPSTSCSITTSAASIPAWGLALDPLSILTTIAPAPLRALGRPVNGETPGPTVGIATGEAART